MVLHRAVTIPTSVSRLAVDGKLTEEGINVFIVEGRIGRMGVCNESCEQSV